MDARWHKVLAVALVLLMPFALVGCAGDDGSDDTTETETEQQADSADTETDDAATDDSASDVDEADLREDAADMAQAWFVGPGSDLTADDVTFEVEAMAQDDAGGWWARVSATPNDTMQYETEQIYMSLDPGMTIWMYFDSGTGIDPATDDRFPTEVRDALQP
jgi:hypothetical protein